MSRQEIDDLLKELPTWRLAGEKCRLGFVQCMANRQYGHDAITNAWHWFLEGYLTEGELL